MTSKKFFITIVAGIIITISYIDLLGLAANNFIVVGNDIVFNFDPLNVKFHFILFYLLTTIPWKVVLWERDWFDIFITQGIYFPFFMMFLIGWFAFDFPTGSFMDTLSMYTAFAMGWTISFVLIGIIPDLISMVFVTLSEKEEYTETEILILVNSILARALENEKAKNDAG